MQRHMKGCAGYRSGLANATGRARDPQRRGPQADAASRWRSAS